MHASHDNPTMPRGRFNKMVPAVHSKLPQYPKEIINLEWIAGTA